MVFEPMLLPPKMFPSRVIVGAAPSKVKLHVFWNDKPKASVMFAVKVWLPFPAGVTNEPPKSWSDEPSQNRFTFVGKILDVV